MHSSPSNLHSDHFHVQTGPTSGSSGRGCIFGILAVVGIVVVVIGITVSVIVQGVGHAVDSAANNESSASIFGGGKGVQTDPTVIADLKVMTSALSSHLPEW